MIVVLAALLVQQAAPAPALPAAPPQPPATMMAEPVALATAGFDADGDGVVTRAELQAGARRSFAALEDIDGGAVGYIGYADWARRWLGDANALPSPFTVDRDGDNRITADELEAALLTAFERLDRDRDGRLARAELLTIRAGATRPVGDNAQPERRRRRR